MPEPRVIAGLRELRDRFDAVLTDQYGVLHDGATAFAGAREAMEWLAGEGVPVAVLSNSGRTGRPNAARLARLGFPGHQYRQVVTSGGLARERLADQLARGELGPGDPILIVASDSGSDLLDGLPLAPADTAGPARWVLIAGAEPGRWSREAYAARLRPLAERGVPALCCNPDLLVYLDGRLDFGPGCIAEDYAAAGGAVTWLGKPGREIFRAGLRAVGDPRPARCLVIGDSPAHDIAGARAAGCLSLLVTAGAQAGLPGAEPDFRIDRLRP